MTAQGDLLALADLCGIWRDFYDQHGNLKPTSPATQRAFLTAIGVDVRDDDATRNSLSALRHEIEDRWFPEEIIIESGVTAPLQFGLGARWQLRLDEHEDVIESGEPCDHITLPPLSSGVYELTATASGRTEIVTVLCAPKRLAAVQDLTGSHRLWGLNLALYGPHPSDERLEFHMWLQWVAETQLAQAQARGKAAGMPLGLYLDFAVGSRRDGAESWCEQAAVAQGVSIGAPPDQLNPEGQNWNLTAFAPRKLRAMRYRPLRRIIAQTIRHAGIIRIDHVLGLNRSYWIPDDGSPGGYIHQPFESLLAIIKIEAERFNCAVVGEDLGLVPDGFRDTMRDNGFYGYSVLQYEKDDHGGFGETDPVATQALSCFATHDTPTVKGYETGRDIDWWEKLDWIDAQAADVMRHDRRVEVDAFRGDSDFQDRVHGHLAHSNATLVTVQLDDVFGVVEAQNLPGTIVQHPNWRRKYDVDLCKFSLDGRLTAVASLMRSAGRSNVNKGYSHDD